MYKIDPYQTGRLEDMVDVYCEMDIDGGGWTIVWASTEDCTAGRPWDEVPAESVAECGLYFDDPRDGLSRLQWEVLQEIPHIVSQEQAEMANVSHFGLMRLTTIIMHILMGSSEPSRTIAQTLGAPVLSTQALD